MLALGVLMSASNWLILARQLRRTSRDEPAPSFVPLAGGILGASGLGMLDVPWTWRWLPFALDFGSAPYVVMALVAMATQRKLDPPA